MNRPYIFCHMLTSLDGKIIGNYMDTPKGTAAQDVFYRIAFGAEPYYHHQGWLSGRITTDDNFTFYKKPVLEENAPPVPAGDYVAKPHAEMYYVSIDPSGCLGWEQNQVTYIDTTAHIIEVLTEKATNSYKAFLRKLGISYVIAGEDALDYTALLEKLATLFGIKTLMLGGGGVLNWSFIQKGLCDEISLVLAATADGASGTPTLFEARAGLAEDIPVSFTLENVQVMEGDSVWLRYKTDF